MMKPFKIVITLIAAILLLLSTGCQDSAKDTHANPTLAPTDIAESVTPQPKEEQVQVGTTELYADIGKTIHGIAADNFGNIFVGVDSTGICKVSSEGQISEYAALKDVTEKTFISNMTVGDDNNLYIAASDRVVKIKEDGSEEVLMKDDFPGEWGACDIKCDKEGNIYISNGMQIVKYDTEKEKTILLDAQKDNLTVSTFAGFNFNSDYSTIYIGVPNSDKIIEYKLSGDDSYVFTKEYRIPGCPQFIDVDAMGNAYANLVMKNALVKLSSDGTLKEYPCDNKLKMPATILLGKKDTDKEFLFVVSFNDKKIYKVYIGQ